MSDLAKEFLEYIHENVNCEDRTSLQNALIEFCLDIEYDPTVLERELIKIYNFRDENYLNCEELEYLN